MTTSRNLHITLLLLIVILGAEIKQLFCQNNGYLEDLEMLISFFFFLDYHLKLNIGKNLFEKSGLPIPPSLGDDTCRPFGTRIGLPGITIFIDSNPDLNQRMVTRKVASLFLSYLMSKFFEPDSHCGIMSARGISLIYFKFTYLTGKFPLSLSQFFAINVQINLSR